MHSRILITCILILLILLIVPIVGSTPTDQPGKYATTDIEHLMESLNYTMVLEHAKYLSNLGSRVTGYPGFLRAAEYIEDYWRKLGFEVRLEKFTVTVPIVHECKIHVKTGEKEYIIRAYPLWPNHINPSPYTSPSEGDILVYCGECRLEEMDGIDLKDKFVLAEFFCRWYWKNALMFGAKGFIFLDKECTLLNTVQKVLNIPLSVPRLYVKGDDADLLRKLASTGPLKIWINSSVSWENVEVSNILCIIPGTGEYGDEVIVIGSHYDTWSVVPELAPGAYDSLGISLLLEMAKFFKNNPPKRSVWLVAFAGHYQSLWGGREFVENHFSELGMKIRIMISIELSGDSDTVAIYSHGNTYGFELIHTLHLSYPWCDKVDDWVRDLESAFNEKFNIIEGIKLTYPAWILNSPPLEPILRCFEAEIFTEACYGGGIGIIATNSFKAYKCTPFDTFDKVNLEKLRKQVISIGYLLFQFVNLSPHLLGHVYPSRIREESGIISLVVQLSRYNRSIDWFSNFTHPNAIILVSISGLQNPELQIELGVGVSPVQQAFYQGMIVPGTIMGLLVTSEIAPGAKMAAQVTPIGISIIAKPDETGKVIIKGVKPRAAVDIQAYIIDPKTGDILYATDSGPFGTTKYRLGRLMGVVGAPAAQAPWVTPVAGGIQMIGGAGAPMRAFAPGYHPAFRYVPVFEATGIAILGLTDIVEITGIPQIVIEPYNFLSHSWLVWRDTVSGTTDFMAFVPPGSIIEIILRGGVGGRIVGVLNNASRMYPEGYGYSIKSHKTLILDMFDIVECTYTLTLHRASSLAGRMTMDPRLMTYLEKAKESYRHLVKALEEKKWSYAYGYALSTWIFTHKLYSSSQNLLYQTAITAAIFLGLSIPFAFLLQKISTAFTEKREILIVVGILVALNAFLSLFHPGYIISSNVMMIVLGTCVLLFDLLFIFIALNELNSIFRDIRRVLLGPYMETLRTSGTMVAGISLGIRNIRRRKLRSVLLLLSFTFVVMAMTAFTSTAVGITTIPIPVTVKEKAYTGVLLKRPIPGPRGSPILPLSEQFMLGVRGFDFKGLDLEIHPRAWIYPLGEGLIIGEKVQIKALLAVSPEEREVFKDEYLVEGRWFVEDDIFKIIISESLRKALSEALKEEIEPGSRITIWNQEFIVKGIIMDEALIGVVDIDQKDILPASLEEAQLRGVEAYLPPLQVIIVPYKFAMEYFNVHPNVISIKIRGTPEDIYEFSENLALALPFDPYYGFSVKTAYGEEVYMSSRLAIRELYVIGGGENIVIPLIISSLTLLSVTLGMVYERIREIGILSSLGISPSSIRDIFISEVMIMAFLGSYLGYTAGTSLIGLLWTFGLYPKGLYPNISSTAMVVTMGMFLLVAALSTIYPFNKASRLVTPTIMRKWSPPTRPRAGRWSIPLPFTATYHESYGILEFLREYFELHSKERMGLFTLIEPPKYTESEDRRELSLRMHIAPFDQGIYQKLSILCIRLRKDLYQFGVLIEREMGVEQIWATTNRRLMDSIRKQFLVWRSLSPEEKEIYVRRFRRWVNSRETLS
ncbi:MAG: hypothetical protein DRJ49_01885 [Thermoprotei archaeon]|nr:MAG: hypothetical protein DRJ49_01885 [Thermoprotei archaeon]